MTEAPSSLPAGPGTLVFPVEKSGRTLHSGHPLSGAAGQHVWHDALPGAADLGPLDAPDPALQTGLAALDASSQWLLSAAEQDRARALAAHAARRRVVARNLTEAPLLPSRAVCLARLMHDAIEAPARVRVTGDLDLLGLALADHGHTVTLDVDHSVAARTAWHAATPLHVHAAELHAPVSADAGDVADAPAHLVLDLLPHGTGVTMAIARALARVARGGSVWVVAHLALRTALKSDVFPMLNARVTGHHREIVRRVLAGHALDGDAWDVWQLEQTGPQRLPVADALKKSALRAFDPENVHPWPAELHGLTTLAHADMQGALDLFAAVSGVKLQPVHDGAGDTPAVHMQASRGRTYAVGQNPAHGMAWANVFPLNIRQRQQLALSVLLQHPLEDRAVASAR